jgi:hypothetical protein
MGGHRASRLRTFCSGVGLNSIGLALLGMSAAAGAQIYVQAYDVSGFALASQNDTSVAGIGAYSTTYDDFTLSSDATITGLRFTGIYFNPGGVGTTTSFQVQFYNDDIGQPGSSVFSTTILGNGGEVCDTGPANPVCAYGVSLNFTALAGTPYWLSIVSNSNLAPQWGWAGGTGGDDSAFQLYFKEGTHENADLAFSLFTAEVPEPSSWALMLLGFLVLGTALRRGARGAIPA